jgi:hypothetical protein
MGKKREESAEPAEEEKGVQEYDSPNDESDHGESVGPKKSKKKSGGFESMGEFTHNTTQQNDYDLNCIVFYCIAR